MVKIFQPFGHFAVEKVEKGLLILENMKKSLVWKLEQDSKQMQWFTEKIEAVKQELASILPVKLDSDYPSPEAAEDALKELNEYANKVDLYVKGGRFLANQPYMPPPQI